MAEVNRIGIREARAQLGHLVDEAYFRDQPTVLTKNEQPRAVIIPYDWYADMTSTARQPESGTEA